MAVRTAKDLQDELDSDLAWRRSETHTLLVQIRASKGPAQAALTRAGIALLYAHWEGYTKNALTHYLRYVSRLRLKLDELAPGFAGVALQHAVMAQHGLSDAQKRTETVRLMIEQPSSRLQIPNKEVNTQGNLNSELCRELFHTFGVDFAPFATKSALIDYNLLRVRNEVAHGRWNTVEQTAYEELNGELLAMLSAVKNVVISAADNALYRRKV